MAIRVAIVVDLLLLVLRLRIVLVGLGDWQTVMRLRQRVIGLRNLLMNLRMGMWMVRVTAVSRARVGGHFVDAVGEMSGDGCYKGRRTLAVRRRSAGRRTEIEGELWGYKDNSADVKSFMNPGNRGRCEVRDS